MLAKPVRPVAYTLEDDGVVPNNVRCPLLVYAGALSPQGTPDMASEFEALFTANDWGSSWRNGVFPFHHYHSTAHEVLGIYAGWAELLLGGEQGKRLRVEAGDAVVIPAGVAHKKLDGADFACVGAYPAGQDPDLCRRAQAHTASLANISAVALPSCDPLYGADGPLFEFWAAGQQR